MGDFSLPWAQLRPWLLSALVNEHTGVGTDLSLVGVSWAFREAHAGGAEEKGPGCGRVPQ